MRNSSPPFAVRRQTSVKVKRLPLTVCVYIATSPAVVWIWNLENVENSRLHALIELMHPVQQVAWSPQTNTVALICNSKVIYMWESRGCAAVQVPGGSSRPGTL